MLYTAVKMALFAVFNSKISIDYQRPNAHFISMQYAVQRIGRGP